MLPVVLLAVSTYSVQCRIVRRQKDDEMESIRKKVVVA
jgi:hypothetical protein